MRTAFASITPDALRPRPVTAPFPNTHAGARPRRVLFVCRYNRMHSPTAERLFCKRADLDVRSAGTSQEALARVNANILEWAEVIFIMDEQQRAALQQRFPRHPALDRLICLEIPDEFRFLQPELIDLLDERVRRHLEETARGTADAAPSTPPANPRA